MGDVSKIFHNVWVYLIVLLNYSMILLRGLYKIYIVLNDEILLLFALLGILRFISPQKFHLTVGCRNVPKKFE